MVPFDLIIDEEHFWVPAITSNSDGTGYSYEDLERFIQILCSDLSNQRMDMLWFGVYIYDARVSYNVTYNVSLNESLPEWAIIVPNNDKPDSRIILREWEDRVFFYIAAVYLDIILEGECNTPERVEVLKEFGFVEVIDEEPVLPPSEESASSA